MSDIKKSGKLTEEEIKAQIKALSDKANETTGLQMELISGENLGDEDIDFGFDPSQLKDTADPDESYRLYYGMQKLLIDHLPKGKNNKPLRQKIYNQKNLFLNRGMEIQENGRRGSDGKMTFIKPFLNEAFTAVVYWVKNGSNPYDIFQTFFDMNKERGYHK